MHTYGQSIYATRGGPYLPGDFGVSTYRGKTIYLHILNPAGTTLTLPALPARILACAALTGGEASCKQSDAGVEVTLRGNPSAADTIVEMTLASPAAVIATIRTAVTPKAK
jgi:alpha-L-fucosidase